MNQHLLQGLIKKAEIRIVDHRMGAIGYVA